MYDKYQVLSAFQNYISAYNPSDPKIRLKIDHTYRVAGLCQTIAKEAGADPDLSWLCGMLHDIGRFEQVRRFNTFVDAESVDHALLSSALLFDDGLIKTFAPDLDNNLSQLLKTSIQCHSLYRIPEDLSKEEALYCNVLRDADKIDIFRVNCDTPPEEIYNVTTDDLRKAAVTPEVKNCFLNHTAVQRSLRKTSIDYLVGHICLVFELVYPVSQTLVKEQGYLQRILSFQSDNQETREWFEYMRQHLREGI